jgi:TolB-like protein
MRWHFQLVKTTHMGLLICNALLAQKNWKESIMKKFVFLAVFTFFAMSIFCQNPSVVVSDFTSRARDVHEDDLVTIMEMFMTSLASGKAVTVIDHTILKRRMESLEFNAGDWSDSVKTTRLGEALNAVYFVSGTMTQLGTSLTFNISVRDIKTLVVIASEQKQYTLENIWDNSVGIPAQLTDMGNAISRGISTDYNKRQQEIQAQLAREEAERKALLAREEAEKKAQLAREEEQRALFNYWTSGDRPNRPPPGSVSIGNESKTFISLQFSADGTFSGTQEYRLNSWSDSSRSGYNLFEGTSYYGNYTRDGNTLRMTWTGNTDSIRIDDNNRGIQTKESTRSSSGSGTYTITFSRDNSGRITSLRLSGSSPFGREYRLR